MFKRISITTATCLLLASSLTPYDYFEYLLIPKHPNETRMRFCKKQTSATID